MATIKGGAKLERALADLSKKVAKKRTLRVGFFEGAKYPDGTSVAMVAALNNYGTRTAPPRPFFSNMVAEKSPKWPDALARILQANDFDSGKALELMGEGIKGQLEQAIIDTDAPPLSQITLMLRKMKSQDQSLIVTGATVGEAARRVKAGESVGGVNAKPLEDSKLMLHSVGYEVSDE